MTFTVSLVVLFMATLALGLSLAALRISTLADRRPQPPALPALPAAVCTCGGTWGKWEHPPLSRSPGGAAAHQDRTCTECGFTERRVIK